MRQCLAILWLALVSGLAACGGRSAVMEPLPAGDPLVRITHRGFEVANSNNDQRAVPRITCLRGQTLGGDIFGIRGGFPAPFTVEISDRWDVAAAEVVVFGGTIVDTDDATRVRSTVQDGENVEVAFKTFDANDGEQAKTVSLGVIPLNGTHEGGPNTVRISARVIDQRGWDARTTDPLVGTAQVLCGPQ